METRAGQGVTRRYVIGLLSREHMIGYLNAIGLNEEQDYLETRRVLDSVFTVNAHPGAHRILRKQILLWKLYQEQKHVVLRFREQDRTKIADIARNLTERMVSFPEKKNRMSLVFTDNESYETFKTQLKGIRHRLSEL